MGGSPSKLESGKCYTIPKCTLIFWYSHQLCILPYDAEIPFETPSEEFLSMKIEQPVNFEVVNVTSGFIKGINVKVFNNIKYENCKNIKEMRFGKMKDTDINLCHSNFIIPCRTLGLRELRLDNVNVTLSGDFFNVELEIKDNMIQIIS